MPRSISSNGHPPIAFGKLGLLLVNLGTPDSPHAKSIRPYLREFLSDRRVIELSPLVWQPILRGIILRTRPRKISKTYQKIWRQETDESPLRFFTRRQAELLQAKLGEGVRVEWAMRYGSPSIADRLATLHASGCDRLAVLALYPQYSATTSASAYDEVFRVLGKMRWQPAVRTAAAWHDDPTYIDALAQSVGVHQKQLDWQPEIILASFHGLPQSYFDKGDPYHCHCAKTTRLLREKLGLSEDALQMTFQSRFGPTKWLQPYTADIVKKLAADGVKRIAVITPGFIADCVETLGEIDITLREHFLAHGGTHFTLVPCLNDSDAALGLLAKLARRELGGWVAFDD